MEDEAQHVRAGSEAVARLFRNVLERKPADRAAFLEEVCGDDEELRIRVEALLAHHEQAPDSFLPLPPVDADPAGDATSTRAGGSCDAERPDPYLGRTIGGYHVKDVIGTGGMGTVYLAMQQEPRRDVAIKIMKRGVASRSALRRFKFEAQLLARLRHPGIAQIYEAGTHDDGTGGVPYFAMEYVPGAVSLIEYAQRKKIETAERLALFVKVCDAVGYGHQKGIIHRDLKPGNILVDSFGQPKIIDFGVARATDSDMAVTTLQTHLRQLIGTVQYMSPEQCRGDSLDLDTRSDVYSLGVVLYELLCGEHPYDLSGTSLPAAMRIVCEHEPTRPSTINRTLRGDVETIALTAMRKDRERRYRSAAELGDDVRRYLSDEPITARPPGLIDTLRRFARRHTAAAAAIASALALMTVTVVVVSIFLVREAALRADAERANERAAQAAAQNWQAVSKEQPGTWADGQAEEAADEARALAGTGQAALEAGRVGDAAAMLIQAASGWRHALRLHAAAVPRLIQTGVEAARAGRIEVAKAALARAQKLGLSDETLQPLAAEFSLRELKMVDIPAGEFIMGDELEQRLAHAVTIPHAFRLSATEITQGQFLAVLGRNPSFFKGDLAGPVDTVTWFDAVEFCNELSRREGRSPRYELEPHERTWDGSIVEAEVRRVEGTGYRLPTEAEWEYGCRAGTRSAFSFGDTEHAKVLDQHMWYRGNSGYRSHPVGKKKPNPFGLHDMHGNVWEWCEDLMHQGYEGAPVDGSAWTIAGPKPPLAEPSWERRGYRVARGGSWFYDPYSCLSATRGWSRPDLTLHQYGFRIAQDGAAPLP